MDNPPDNSTQPKLNIPNSNLVDLRHQDGSKRDSKRTSMKPKAQWNFESNRRQYTAGHHVSKKISPKATVPHKISPKSTVPAKISPKSPKSTGSAGSQGSAKSTKSIKSGHKPIPETPLVYKIKTKNPLVKNDAPNLMRDVESLPPTSIKQFTKALPKAIDSLLISPTVLFLIRLWMLVLTTVYTGFAINFQKVLFATSIATYTWLFMTIFYFVSL